ncbi:hypothetical protein GCM10022221_24790 [Actinocorallia aurea]
MGDADGQPPRRRDPGRAARRGSGTGAEALLGTGFCGALTTFSTFELDTVHLFKDGKYTRAAVNVVASLALGIIVFAALQALLGGA